MTQKEMPQINVADMSTSEIKELHARFGQEIDSRREGEKAEALNQIKTLVQENGIQKSELNSFIFPKSKSRGSTTKTPKGQPKYRNPETGDTWTGRGRQPDWIKGKDKDQFLIQKPQAGTNPATDTTTNTETPSESSTSGETFSAADVPNEETKTTDAQQPVADSSEPAEA